MTAAQYRAACAMFCLRSSNNDPAQTWKEINEMPQHATVVSFYRENAVMALEAANYPELLSIAKRWLALDGGAWHADRHAADKAQLLQDTEAAIAKAEADVQ